MLNFGHLHVSTFQIQLSITVEGGKMGEEISSGNYNINQ